MTLEQIFKEFIRQFPNNEGVNTIAWFDAQRQVHIIMERSEKPYEIARRYLVTEDEGCTGGIKVEVLQEERKEE